MTNYKIVNADNLDAQFQNIANAIREKTGSNEPIPDSEFANEILSIEAGGDTSIEDAILNGQGVIDTYTNNRITKLRSYALYEAKITRFNSTSVLRLGAQCFSRSTLEECNTPNAQYASSGATFDFCASLKRLYLPNMKSAFSNNCKSCTALSYIYLGQITTLGTNCFQNCTNLITLVISTPTLCALNATNVFTSTPIESGTGYIYVPKALIENYKVATNWVNFAEQFRAIEDYPDICGGATE